ncbi:formate dehydrogenase subunit alpha [Alkalilimnicola ehrlichii MLHE-1]|uniref:Formate dehydrogenase alpha subunit n=1 Tax=Alkalilimnicola ehrlichii (strain ATCC BAA-1101 / DSM 17681 / MLHE-1) TaxID=187272 RepID=Q0A952_ALKEH|nr:formate dehydrogenase subunit alpha [Alkalilimnicola ehrlichii]ABI56635.1 formate dehydrogenase alpha subunit [Alkalilimnicola ehrlichii MLHE-1]
MKLEKRKGSSAATAVGGFLGRAVDRRTFLRGSGLAVGGTAAAAAMLEPRMMRKAKASERARFDPNADIKEVKTVCTHCSVGCGVIAEVQNGVWVGQEPNFDSPINLGAHCAKGASLRNHGHSGRRTKYPMKLVNGRWERIGWEQAIEEIGDKLLQIREESGPDALWFAGSSKASNEGAYLQRKFAAFWGSNNCDHQARICHSTTVAGVANTWGYGAMTNSYNDITKSNCIVMCGSNAAEAHPVAMQMILRGKENGAKLIVMDPRFTRTAAHSDIFVRPRSGTDVALIYGILWHIFENGWEDSTYIRQRVWGMDRVREEVAHWTPEEVERVAGVGEEALRDVAKTIVDNSPMTFIWCMGGTQHTIGNNYVRAYNHLLLATGNVGVSGGGANIFRGHDNVQGATDVGPNAHILPGYFPHSEGGWRHWARVWDVDYEYLQGRFDPAEYDDGSGGQAKPMHMPGIPVSRWIDGVLEDADNLSQKDNIRAVMFWGHAPNSQTRLPEMKEAMEKLDLLVIADPYPTVSAVLHDRQNDTYLLPACTQFETRGSATASNRSLQWRDKVIEPLFEGKPDHEIAYLLARKLGFADEMFKNIRIEGTEPVVEDVLREINRGTWTIGYTGQSPERLKKHMENQATFDVVSLKAEGGPCDGEYYGLPWPCWGTAEMGHPGTPNLYDTSKHVAEGGLTFRARFGTEYEGENLLAEGSYSKGSAIRDGYPEITADMIKQLGWWDDLTDEEKAQAEGRDWKTDLSGGLQRVAIKHGLAPFGNAKARCYVWNFPDPVPVHREPLYTPRYDLVSDYPTYEDRKAFYRLPTRWASVQAQDYSGDYPLIHTSGRLVEYEGGGEETRSNPWLAELKQEMFVEINPRDANNAGVRNNEWVWLEGPEGGRIRIKALVTRRVAAGTVFTPFHFGGHFQGEDLLAKYPEGASPYVRGESNNTATTYGYDSVTMMQETKTTLCRVVPA